MYCIGSHYAFTHTYPLFIHALLPLLLVLLPALVTLSAHWLSDVCRTGTILHMPAYILNAALPFNRGL